MVAMIALLLPNSETHVTRGHLAARARALKKAPPAPYAYGDQTGNPGTDLGGLLGNIFGDKSQGLDSIFGGGGGGGKHSTGDTGSYGSYNTYSYESYGEGGGGGWGNIFACTMADGKTKGFACKDGTCIPGSHECDDTRQCPDGSDEQGCHFECLLQTGLDGYRCPDGSCVLGSRVCDGDSNCPGGARLAPNPMHQPIYGPAFSAYCVYSRVSAHCTAPMSTGFVHPRLGLTRRRGRTRLRLRVCAAAWRRGRAVLRRKVPSCRTHNSSSPSHAAVPCLSPHRICQPNTPSAERSLPNLCPMLLHPPTNPSTNHPSHPSTTTSSNPTHPHSHIHTHPPNRLRPPPSTTHHS